MGTRIGGFIGFSTSASAAGAQGIWNADSQSYFMRQGVASWVGGESFGPIQATGGTIVTPGNGYKYHYFTSTAPFNVSAGIGACTVYIVGGGGGGGHWSSGGGGGAGGFRTVTTSIEVGEYTVTIGAGGANADPAKITGTHPFASGSPGVVGSATTITSLRGTQFLNGIYASGGGAGYAGGVIGYYSSGGSGGGDSSYRNVEGNPGSSPANPGNFNIGNLGGFTPPEGNRGGYTGPGGIAPNYGASGGGGAGGIGGAGSPTTAGAGGDGAAFADPTIPSTYGAPGPDGALRYFAAGGGGGTYTSGTAAGGFGGGGMGGSRSGIGAAHNPTQDGVTNTGSGGGGLGDNIGAPYASPGSCGSGRGGSGICIIKYQV